MSPRKFFPAQKCFQGRALSPKGRPLHPERSEGCNRAPRGVKDRPRNKDKISNHVAPSGREKWCQEMSLRFMYKATMKYEV